MKRIFTLLTFFISTLSICTLSVAEGYAQLTGDNYPVQAHVYVQQPSLKMPEYFTSSRMLSVDLILKDLTKTTLDVYLGWQITGLGLGLEAGTLPGFVPPNYLSLTKGSKRNLKGIDLREYFQPGMLAVSGVGENVIFNGKLPEGFYTLKITAYEAGTGRQVSNTAETYFSVAYALPPVINLPLVGSEQPVTRPQSVLLQWMPRHTATSSNRITYSGKVCEIAEDEDPNVAINGSQNCFTIPAQQGTSYLLKASDLPLKVGKRYAFQVQVTDNNEQLEFQNQGYSEVSWFRFGEACKPPAGIRISQLSPGRIHLSWNLKTEALGYKIFYKASDESVWSETTTIMQGITFPNLDVTKSYVFKVATLCDIEDESEPSVEVPWEFEEQKDAIPEDLITKVLNPEWEITGDSLTRANDPLPKTLEDLIDPAKIPCAGQVNTYEQCSDDHPAVVTTPGTEPQTALAPGDLITIYDYVVVVTAASCNGNGICSGKGLARVEFMRGSMMPVEFSNVTVMKDPNQPRGGCVTTVPESGYFRVRSGMSYGDIKKEELEIINQERCKIQPEDCELVTFEVTLDDYRDQSKDIKEDLCEGTAISQQKIDSYISSTREAIASLNKWLSDIVELDSASSKLNLEVQTTGLKRVIASLETNIACLQSGSCKCEEFDPIDIGHYISFIKTLISRGIEIANESDESPKISGLEVIDIDTETAAVKWNHDARFKQYKLIVESADGQTQTHYIQAGDDEDFNSIFDLEGLDEDTPYYVTLEAYTQDGLADVAYTTFTTKAVEIPKPYNVKIGELSDNKVKITWDKDPLHESYIVEYTGPDGITHRITTTDPEAFIEIGEDGRYDFTIIAIGKKGKESEPYIGTFNMEKRCFNFSGAVRVESEEFGKEKTVSPGTEVTLSFPQIQVKLCRNEIEWYKDGEKIGEGATITVKVSTSRETYSGICTSVFNGPNADVTRCEKEVTLSAIPFCATTEITTSKTQVSDGEKLLLSRVAGCEAATESYWTNTQGEVIGNSENVFVTAKHGERNIWYLNCKNGTEICRTASPAVEVKDPCDEMLLWIPRVSLDFLLVNMAGCENDYEIKFSSSDVKKHKRYYSSDRGYYKSWVESLGGKSSLIDFRKFKGDKFTISMRCGKECDWKEIEFDKSKSCERNWCETIADTRTIKNTNLVEVSLVASSTFNELAINQHFEQLGEEWEEGINNIPFAGPYFTVVNFLIDRFKPEWSPDGWVTKQHIERDKNRSCGGKSFVYYWRELEKYGERFVFEKKEFRQFYNIEKREVIGGDTVELECNTLQVLIPSLYDNEILLEVDPGQLLITQLNNGKDYISLRGCENDFEEGLWLITTRDVGTDIVLASETANIRVGYDPWALDVQCLLSGNLYANSHKGGKNFWFTYNHWNTILLKGFGVYRMLTAGTNLSPDGTNTVGSSSRKVPILRGATQAADLLLGAVCGVQCFSGSGLGMLFDVSQDYFLAGKGPNYIDTATEMLNQHNVQGLTISDLDCGCKTTTEWTRFFGNATKVVNVAASVIDIVNLFKGKKSTSYAVNEIDASALTEEVEASLQTYFPLENFDFGSAQSTSNISETYLGENVAKKVLNDLCNQLSSSKLGKEQREEALCKVYNNLKNAGITLLPNPVEDPQALEEFRNGNCDKMIDLWSNNGQRIPESAAKQALNANTNAIESAGNGECANESKKTLTVSIEIIKHPTCKNDDGEIRIMASGGDGKYQYSLSPTSGWQVKETYNTLSAQQYNIRVRDGQNNYGDASITLSGAAIMDIELHWLLSSCDEPYGNQLIPTVNGGTPPYLYAHGDGDFKPTPEINKTTRGGSRGPLKVKDDTGCIQEKEIPSKNRQLTISTEVNNASCGEEDGRITVNASCGDDDYEYALTGQTEVASQPGRQNPPASVWKKTNIFENLKPDTYTIRVRDGDGNRGEVMVELTAGEQPMQLTVETEPARCSVEGGSITLHAKGGCGNYQYSINGGKTYQQDSVFSGLEPDTYQIYVKDATNTTVTDKVSFETINAEYAISEGKQVTMAMARTTSDGKPGGKIICELQFDAGTKITKVCLDSWIMGSFDPNTNLLTITGFKDSHPELEKYIGTYYSAFNVDNKDIFKNFYRKDFYDNPGGINPCTPSTSLSKGNDTTTVCRSCAEGWLPESFFNRECDIRPKELVPHDLKQLIAEMVETAGYSKSYSNQNSVLYNLKIFKSDPNTTVLRRIEIVDSLTTLQPRDIALWIDVHEDGSVKYEFFTGSDIILTQKEKALFNKWLEALDPYIMDMPFNPFVAILEGVADLAKEYLKVPAKYWDCNSTDYYKLPWIAECLECITPKDWALLCGVWDGVVDEVTGLVEFVAILADSQKRNELLNSLNSLLEAETWSAMWNELEKKHTDKAGKPCQLAHQVGLDITAVGSLVLPITKVSKAQVVATVSNLADNVVLTLTKFKNVANEAYKVATGTITIVKEGTGFLINRIGATTMWTLGESMELFENGTRFSLAMATNGYEAIGPNGLKIAGELLLEDANQAIVRMKQASNEVLVVISNDLTPLLLRSGEDFTLLSNARRLPGSVTGNGINIKGTWLKGSDGNAGLFPKSVADKLRGKSFNSFDEFREAFWKEVANDPHLATQFKPQNISLMKQGKAPIPVEEQWLGGQKTYILHHKTPINQGGGVYDVDNLYIVTPKYHKEILTPEYHYGYGY